MTNPFLVHLWTFFGPGAKAVLMGLAAAVGAYLATLAIAGILDLCCTDGGLRAIIDLPMKLIDSLEECRG